MIDILLATFNGEVYLREQLDSILAQSHDEWQILTRDDGSEDQTREIIQEYQEKHPDRIKIIDREGEHLGPANNFGRLLAGSESEYVMFSDQDDVWIPEKIVLSMEKMTKLEKQHGTETPLLVHTDLRVVDQELRTINKSFIQSHRRDPKISKVNRLLVQNHFTGSTILINRSLLKIASPVPATAVMHDWWLGLVAALLGKMLYLDLPTVLYRQHKKNVLGAGKQTAGFGPGIIFSRLAGKWRRFKNYRSNIRKFAGQAKEFLRYDESMSAEIKQAVAEFAELPAQSWLARRRIIIRNGIWKNSFRHNIYLMLFI